MNPNEFSYTFYKNLLGKLLESRANFCFKDFVDKTPEGGFLILRHDVDYSPEAALQMAELESNLGINATYFILLSSPYYNLFDEKYVSFPKRLIEMGHEVGLHYDVQAIEKVTHHDSAINILLSEIDLLSKLSDSEVLSISMHNPSIAGNDLFQKTDLVNAYDERYTKQIGYFSDSCGAWRDNFVECLMLDRFPKQMQLLIHPLFWSPSSLTRWQVLNDFIEYKKIHFLDSIEEIKDMWNSHIGVIQHEKRKESTQFE